MTKQIEIEHRARFSKDKHQKLFSYLQEHATDLGQDDKNVYFFTLPDKLIKVTNNTSNNSAKITSTLDVSGEGSDFEEIEFQIDPNDTETAVDFFKSLGFVDVHSSFQTRRNFMFKEVEIALKHSDMWGYHAEFEIVVDDRSKKEGADEKIRSVANELDVSLMTEKELKAFVKRKEAEMGNEER